MKKQIIVTYLLLLGGMIKSQNSPTWPASGNVGIGTTNPALPLDIVTDEVDGGISITQSDPTHGGSWLFMDNISGQRWGLVSTGAYNNIRGGHFAIYDFNFTAEPRLFISGSNGNIGFGTHSPSNKLSMLLSTSFNDGISVNQSGPGAASLFLNQIHGGAGRGWSLSSDNNGNLQIDDATMGINFMHFDGQSKNTGLGTINPSKKFEVAASNNSNDGIMISQSNNSYSASLFLNHTGAGKEWSINSGFGGDFTIFDATTNVNRLFISGANGNVGIGTTIIPLKKLQIDISNTNPDGVLIRQTGSGQAAILFTHATATKQWSLLANSQGNFSINESTTNTDYLIVNGTSGKVGIGTNNPSARLAIQATENQTLLGNNTDASLRLCNQYTTSFGKKFEILFAIGQNANQRLAVIAGEYSRWNNTAGNAGGDLVFGTSDGISMLERMRINADGKVFIGTQKQASGSYINALLHVNGTAVARELVVTQQNWADFVFDNDYKLMPLKELERFYQNNHHLPDVPTTSEIIENGNELGKTDATLLRKIEELTLYMVAQQKQIDAQEKEIQLLVEKLKDKN